MSKAVLDVAKKILEILRGRSLQGNFKFLPTKVKNMNLLGLR